MNAGPTVVEPLPEREASWWIRALFALQRRRYGDILEPSRIWARSPAALAGFVGLFAAVDRKGSPLGAALRSMIMVRVAQVNRCGYCVDVNAAILQRRGVQQEQLLALAEHEKSAAFSPRERSALDYAVAVSLPGATVEEEVFARLREHFDERALVDLTALIALQIASCKFNSALRIPPQGFCFIPADEPPR